MRMKITLVFDDAERRELNQFQSLINAPNPDNPKQPVISLERLCKQAIFMTVQRAYADARQKAAQLQQEQNKNGKSTSGDASGIADQVSPGQDANTAVVAEATASGDTSTGPGLIQSE